MDLLIVNCYPYKNPINKGHLLTKIKLGLWDEKLHLNDLIS